MNFYEAIHQVTGLLPDCNEAGVAMFFEYAPHVERFFVRVYADGWEVSKQPNLELEFRAPGDPLGETLHEVQLGSIKGFIKAQKQEA
jgi:hypothetical protein